MKFKTLLTLAARPLLHCGWLRLERQARRDAGRVAHPHPGNAQTVQPNTPARSTGSASRRWPRST